MEPTSTIMICSVAAGIGQLLRAYDCALEARSDVWDFAVEIDVLRAVGMTANDIRWLVAKGLVEHGEEISVFGDEHRTIRASRGFTFLATTAFVLTPGGAVLAHELLAGFEPSPGNSLRGADPPFPPGEGGSLCGRSQRTHLAPRDADPPRPMREGWGEGAPQDGNGLIRRLHTPRALSLPPTSIEIVAASGLQLPHGIKPIWDPRRRELRVGDYLVKRFRVPAENQELILAAFQEEGWPDVIDDPLPPSPEIVPKRRLRDVITRLNGGQVTPILRFCGNGNGEGVEWRIRTVDRSKQKPNASLRQRCRSELTAD
jgi:hypothetical protein